MSCKHGNWSGCEECAAEDEAYRAGIEEGKADGWASCESCHGIVDGVRVREKQLEAENARLREELAAWKEGHTKEKLSAIEWAGKCQELQEQLATLKAELDKANPLIERAFAAHPNLDLDIEFAMQKENGK